MGSHEGKSNVAPCFPGENDSEVFVRSLYEQAAPSLYAFIYRFTRDRALAEDVLQEVFVRAWRRAGHLEPTSDALRRWLFAATRNHLIDVWRARTKLSMTTYCEHVAAAAHVVDDVDRIVQRRVLTDAIHELTPKHRDVLMERYFQCRSIAETARRLGVSSGTVKSRTYHALRALRVLLEEGESRLGDAGRVR
ncbi:sigma-70 family RNA polymerase sigma factor [Pseudonocardia sp. CA-142604]|uniref:sigma-70 family RNA polymerase sigma factor n=1 Tax=Pseudonocardia sp. CA-142604 TaxID=3240024 RepID=UPI003D8C0D95